MDSNIRPQMAQVKRVRPQIGDVLEVRTPSGLAYAHYTHMHDRYGALLRVMPGVYLSRPIDFAACVSSTPQFMTFFPVGAASNRRLMSVVAHEAIPHSARSFPTFRTRATKNGAWWLWDGENEWHIGALRPGMEQFPIRGVWNDTLLIKRIVEGWRHEHDV